MNEVVRLTPADVIRDIHTLAAEMGAERLRVDRSGWGGTLERPDAWIEVGYGCGEIKVRTSVPTLVYRADVDRVGMDEVIDLFESLLCTLDTKETS
jgi:hypothetical protein